VVSASAVYLLLVAHLVGDYVLQSDWMAQEKTQRWWPAIAHAVIYGMPFVLVTRSPLALAVIVVTHAVIDRYRLARYLVWANNLLAPARYRHPWTECAKTGYHEDRPLWMTVWLMIIADNTLHLTVNYASVRWM